MLEMINVSYAYKSKKEIVHVLDKVTYRFEIGEMYGIFGPSGSGKTTCLSLLAGLEKPDEGEILLDGENIQDIGGRKLRQNSISLVFQDYQLFDYMTSLENVMVAAQISLPDVPKKELIKMCRDSLVMVGLDDSQITRKVTELSGGQQQRVAIARALITDAKYILADEPTGNLDKENRRKIVELLQQIAHEQDRCVIVVTHSDYVKKNVIFAMIWEMTMRNKWWQACKELLGRPGRNILIAICIFVLTLFCGIATFLDSAIESFYKSFADMAGCCVLVESDDFSTLDDWKDILEYADNNKNVVGYNNAFTSDIICEAADFENVPYTEKQSDFEKNKIYVSGNINTSYNEYFSSGIFKISKGKYPMSGDKGAMISDKLASENNLSIGSNISIQYENNTISIKVIGIYTVINTPKAQVSDGYYKEVADSIVFTDYNSYVELNNEASCYGINFFSTDYKSTSLLYADMSKMFQNVPNSAVVNQVLNEELQMTDVISMLKSMTSVTLSVMYIVCVVVMSLLTVLWLKGHSKMIAIYNTLGQRKFRTIQILLYEILMITVPALVGAGILTLGLLNRFSVNIFKYFVEFCEISNFQKSFSLDIWNFEMNIWQFVYRIGFLEISIILITMIGSCIYANKGVRTLRSN